MVLNKLLAVGLFLASSSLFADVVSPTVSTVVLSGKDGLALYNALATKVEKSERSNVVVKNFKSESESLVIRCEANVTGLARRVTSAECVVTTDSSKENI